jgi:hypothetical protein
MSGRRLASSTATPAVRPSPVVPLSDQALYLAHTAAGHEAVIQLIWLYRHPVDLDGLARFKSHLERGLLARLIRPSTLPIGRHHWVGVPPPDSDLAVGSEPLSSGDLHAWADEQVQLPLDPARGPGWNLTVQPVADGSTVVSLVVSHCIADGMATVMAVCEAVRGKRRPLEYLLHPGPQGRPTALAREARQLLRDSPATLRALARLVVSALQLPKLARRPPARMAPSPVARAATQPDRVIALPSVSVSIPSSIWSARVKGLGVGHSTLLTAMAATLGARLGRARDGSVLVMFPVSLRSGSSDSGGNRVSIATLQVGIDGLSTSLKDVQRALSAKMRAARRRPSALEALLPLIPFVPRWLVAAGSNLAFGFSASLPVSCSYIGTLPPDMLRIDGTDADVFTFRGVDRQLSQRRIERRGGVATLLSGFVRESLVLNFVAYQPDAVTDSAQLRTMAEQILAEHQLQGEVLL